MKVISLDDAKNSLPAICDEALSGEIIRFRSANGAEFELMPIHQMPPRQELSPAELAKAYDDADWAKFENNCGKAAD
jgi:hypothetical protein